MEDHREFKEFKRSQDDALIDIAVDCVVLLSNRDTCTISFIDC